MFISFSKKLSRDTSCHRTAALSVGRKVALGSLFFGEEIVAEHSEAGDQRDILFKIHSAVHVCVQILEDLVQFCLVSGFLQWRKVLA